MQLPSEENIEKVILENYLEYQYLFVEFQSKFLSDLYGRYQSVEHGNLVLYFTKQAHQDILRKKDYDLSFNLSLEKFWDNCHKTNPTRKPIIKIAKDICLPKETTRRKILELVKQKVLNKKNKNIRWPSAEEHKKNYNLVTNQEIENVVKLISFVCKKLNYFISNEAMQEEIKDKFSFYWFHYLGAQLDYLKLWSKQLNDLELGFIFLQTAHLFTSKEKKKNLNYADLYDNPSIIKEFIGTSISATSIAEVTGIPRATCVRKLKFLVKMKALSEDEISKRYYFIPNTMSDSFFSREITRKVIKLFSNFFFICLRPVDIKI